MKLVVLSLLLVFFTKSSFSDEPEQASRPINVFGLKHLIDSFEKGGGVYVCRVTNREMSTTSDRSVERGIVFLQVIKTFRGTNRESITLPYSFVPRPVSASNGDLIWPDLRTLGKNNLMCVVIPNGIDFTAYLSPDRKFHEAASKVIPVKDENDIDAKDIERFCRIYDTEDTAQLAKELQSAVNDVRPGVREFALQAAAIKLSRTAPDKALEIIQARAVQYLDNPENLNEAEQFISFVKDKVGSVQPWKPMNYFFCRCFVALTRSPSPAIREAAIGGIAHAIVKMNYVENFSLKDGLNAREKGDLRKVIDSQLARVQPNTTNSNLRVVDEWLGGKKNE